MRVQMTYRDLSPTLETEHLIFKEVAKLERLYPQQFAWCHVIIDQPHRHHHTGRPFRVRVTLQGPLGHFTAINNPNGGHASQLLPGAINEAFRATRHQLRRRARAKKQEALACAPLASLQGAGETWS